MTINHSRVQALSLISAHFKKKASRVICVTTPQISTIMFSVISVSDEDITRMDLRVDHGRAFHAHPSLGMEGNCATKCR